MKDYRDQIRSVIVSNFMLDSTVNRNNNEITGLGWMSGAVAQINKLIQNEVSSLESEIVRLTEQLSEYDSLMSDTIRRAGRNNIGPALRHRGKR